jgi:ferredoxin
VTISKRIVLRFPKRLVDRPIVYKLVKDYDLEFNVLRANITQDAEGVMVVELKGDQKNYDRGIKYLTGSGVVIQSLSQDVTRNKDRCTDCGACVSFCPADAFQLDPVNRTIKFDNEKCIGCAICIKACPPRAMELHF